MPPETQGTPPAEAPPPAAPITETPNGVAPAIPEPPAKEDPMGKRFAALTRKEKELLKERQELKAEREKWESERQSFNSDREKASQTFEIIANAKKNPKALLDHAGVTFDELTQFILNDEKIPADTQIAELNKKIEEEREARIAAEKAREEQELARQNAAITQLIDDYRKEVEGHITTNPERYELVVAYGAQDEVFSRIRDHFAEHGTILSPEDAAGQIEAELESTLEEILKLNKTKAKLTPPAPEATKTEPVQAKTSKPKTLTSQQVSPAPQPTGPLSREERLKRAISKISFKG